MYLAAVKPVRTLGWERYVFNITPIMIHMQQWYRNRCLYHGLSSVKEIMTFISALLHKWFKLDLEEMDC